MKDNFSHVADKYAHYRPSYPKELFDYILSLCPGRECAWDCATGNGQIAYELAAYFKSVAATDISEKQLDHALQKDNIRYSLQPAEEVNFPDSSFDLITVAQAIHWFDFDRFYGEVKRTLKPEGIFVALGYDLIRINTEVDRVIGHLYSGILEGYWDPERRYIDEAYRSIPFPFSEIEAPVLVNEQEWDLQRLTGYLETWSAVKHYQQREGKDPVKMIMADLELAWGDAAKPLKVSFPIFIRAGKNHK